MKRQKPYAVITSLFLSSFAMASAMADTAPAASPATTSTATPAASPATTSTATPSAGQAEVSSPPQVQVKNFDCHYAGAKDSQDMKAKITKDGDNYFWTDSVGESGPLKILPNREISLDYSYVADNKEKVSGKMTFKVKEDYTLDGTFADNYDSGKITCVERK